MNLNRLISGALLLIQPLVWRQPVIKSLRWWMHFVPCSFIMLFVSMARPQLDDETAPPDADIELTAGISGAEISTSAPERFQRFGFALPISPATGKRYRPEDIVGAGIHGAKRFHYVWFRDGYVSAGTAQSLSSYRPPYSYWLPTNPDTGVVYQPDDIVGMAVDGEGDRCLVWFDNGYFSVGSSWNLDQYRQLVSFELPPNPVTGRQYVPRDVVAIAADGERYVQAWFSDGWTSSASGNQLRRFSKPLPASENLHTRSIRDIVGVGINEETGSALAWFVGSEAGLF